MALKVLLVNDDLSFINLEDKNAYNDIRIVYNVMIKAIMEQRKCSYIDVLFDLSFNENKSLEETIHKVIKLKALENMYDVGTHNLSIANTIIKSKRGKVK